jgi:D-serine deaminase-like pyridoxal phosphate-dependent protein
MKNWYKINNAEDLISPSLIVYPERIKKNIQMMIEIAGGTKHLRPHIKTHKIAEIVKLQIDAGISKFKCATIAEAEILANCRATDILLAMQPVATDVNRFIRLIEKYPEALFSTIVDNNKTVAVFSELAASNKIEISLWLDINNGMNRTGIEPGKEALKLYQSIHKNELLIAKGLHVYDGHIHNSDIEGRTIVCNRDFESVLKLKEEIENSGIKVATIVAGGTPTFPIHKNRKDVETSPGTPLLWDEGYSRNYKDLKFLQAAVLLTRVRSKPTSNLTCFDLGHKSVASEMAMPRVKFLETDNFKQISQSEEHLVIESLNNEVTNIGDLAYVVPFHICPTVSKYKEVYTVNDHKISGQWTVAARDNKISI